MTNSKNLQKYLIRIVHAIRLNVNSNVIIFEYIERNEIYLVSLRQTYIADIIFLKYWLT